MKLCEMVFELHQRPSAITGADGKAISAAACAAASPTISASPPTRPTCSTGPRCLTGALPSASLSRIEQRADGRVLRVAADPRQADADGVLVGVRGPIVGLSQVNLPFVPVAERDNLTGAGDALQVRPFLARRLPGVGQLQVEVAAGGRQIVVPIVGLGE